jgi:hypothetical protein
MAKLVEDTIRRDNSLSRLANPKPRDIGQPPPLQPLGHDKGLESFPRDAWQAGCEGPRIDFHMQVVVQDQKSFQVALSDADPNSTVCYRGLYERWRHMRVNSAGAGSVKWNFGERVCLASLHQVLYRGPDKTWTLAEFARVVGKEPCVIQ